MRFPRQPGAKLIPSFASLLLATTFALADVARTGPTPDVPLPDFGASALRLFGALALVLSLFFGGVWVYRNWRHLAARRGQQPRLQVLEARPLGGRHAVYVIAYEEQRFLIASSPAGLSFLANLPPSTPAPERAAEASRETAGAGSAFHESLRAILNRQ
jgi:flagellar biogenesis protein FliO